MIVHIQVDQLLTQLLIEQLDTFLHNTGTLDIYIRKFDVQEIDFDKMAVM